MTRSVPNNMPDTMPNDMKVIIASPVGGPETLQLAMRPVPQMKSEEVLIKVIAAGVNGADMKERQGKYPVPPVRRISWVLRYPGKLLLLAGAVADSPLVTMCVRC